MRCEQVARRLPAVVDAGAMDVEVVAHVESCLRCQAELARYRKMLRGLQLLRTSYLEPAPGLLAQTLAAVAAANEARAVRSVLTGRHLAYAGAIGGAVAATGAAATAVIIHKVRRRGALV